MNKHHTAPAPVWKAVRIVKMWSVETRAGVIVCTIGGRSGDAGKAALIADAPELLRELAKADALLHEALNLLDAGQKARLAERAAAIHDGERARLLDRHCRRDGA